MHFPTCFMEEVTNNENDYVDNRRVLEPNLQTWDQKRISESFDIQSIYNLLYLIFYMGVVFLTCKTDYCKYYNNWPYHPIMHEMGMGLDCFLFM